MFLAFPEFNIWSAPLLFLSLQGLVFALLLLNRYLKKRSTSDLFLFFILMVTCYQQTCYTIGFMGWYDTFRNTKVNYWLIPMSVTILPLIYLYVKSITMSSFRFRRIDWLHFLPAFVMILYRISIFGYDASLHGFGETQNGYLKINLDEPYVLPIYTVFSYLQNLLYLAFTFQLFFVYRKKIKEFFSNTYKIELNWILSFLVLYALLYLYDFVQTMVTQFIVELSYVQQWWMTLYTGLIIIYVGVKGYFTDTTRLRKLNFSFAPSINSIPNPSENEKTIAIEDIKSLTMFMEAEKPYLNPELNLADLAILLGMTRAQLSETINSGFKMNFNDFVNKYRVEAFKEKLLKEEYKKLSLLGIAFECGFNSKATFNRVFKKLTHASPTEYLKTS
ncbi:helix-turn-helix domain-containing protein [uncultured Croceitalea sp.]|uniref:helix-turn-helix domain-containing protein n=1 Tax=uncultured Croceitalea sp. TaxID=1798908 RepID=UPI0033067BF8